VAPSEATRDMTAPWRTREMVETSLFAMRSNVDGGYVDVCEVWEQGGGSGSVPRRMRSAK
jgi:hypothetical protein